MTTPPRRPLDGYARLAWTTLAYTVAVILWGAFVRATGSGAGCGDHWPRCNGEVIPRLESTETLIEFTHRVTSGVALLMVVAMLVWALRRYPRGHRVRRGAGWTMVIMVVEALLGAGLVLLQLVEDNASAMRAVAMALHLANTFLLLGAMTLTAWWASGGAPVRLRGQGAVARAVLVAVALTIVVGSTGAVTALGDMLFPKSSIGLDLASDPSVTRHFLERLRVVHPLVAVATAVYVALMAMWLRLRRPTPLVRRTTAALVVVFFVQLFLGVVNIVLRAPVWMQLSHLLVADALWIVLVLAGAAALAREEAEAPAAGRPRAPGRAGALAAG